MSWEGFIVNRESTRFYNLRVEQQFVRFLNRRYGATTKHKNKDFWTCMCKNVIGCPFHIVMKTVSDSI